MKIISQKIVLSSLLFWFFSSSCVGFNHLGFPCKQKGHPYGMIATDTLLDDLEHSLPSSPPVSHSGKSLVTLNNMGFDVLDPQTAQDSFLIKSIEDFSRTAKHPILEIGGGYGRLSKIMLDQGATVIENDLDLRHLVYGRKMVDLNQRERLYLNTYSFPQGMIIKPNTLSGVILYRVIHLMKPDEIEEGFAKINRWLIPGGKVFIAVLPPHHRGYKDKVLSEYENRWHKGNPWPGFGFKAEDLLPAQAYALPKILHVMDERPLKLALEKYGFTVERTGFIEMKAYHTSAEGAGQELFGLIAVKK